MAAHSDHAVLFTCEHGGNHIPDRYASRFAAHQELLSTHRGWDIGTLATARYFAKNVPSQLFDSETSRLLVDLNRSETNPALFSKLVPPPTDSERNEILATWYRPWRQAVHRWVGEQAERRAFVWHVSFHSFTPVLDGHVRTAEIGLLYDPRREPERHFCQLWQANLRHVFPGFRIRRNYPYLGTADGHTTALRKEFPANEYAGIELEINQQLFHQAKGEITRLTAGLYGSWQQSLRQATARR